MQIFQITESDLAKSYSPVRDKGSPMGTVPSSGI